MVHLLYVPLTGSPSSSFSLEGRRPAATTRPRPCMQGPCSSNGPRYRGYGRGRGARRAGRVHAWPYTSHSCLTRSMIPPPVMMAELHNNNNDTNMESTQKAAAG